MRERMALKHYPIFEQDKKPDRVVEAEYIRVDLASRRTYDVVVEGEVVGRITRATQNTDRKYGRIRVPGKGRPAWSWRRSDGRNNPPGMYSGNRRDAVARILGYTLGEKVEGGDQWQTASSTRS